MSALTPDTYRQLGSLNNPTAAGYNPRFDPWAPGGFDQNVSEEEAQQYMRGFGSAGASVGLPNTHQNQTLFSMGYAPRPVGYTPGASTPAPSSTGTGMPAPTTSLTGQASQALMAQQARQQLLGTGPTATPAGTGIPAPTTFAPPPSAPRPLDKGGGNFALQPGAPGSSQPAPQSPPPPPSAPSNSGQSPLTDFANAALGGSHYAPYPYTPPAGTSPNTFQPRYTAPSTLPPQPGGTQLPYGGQQPGAPTPYPNFAATPQSSGQSTQYGTSGLDPRLDALYQYALQQATSRYADPNGQQFYSGNQVAGFTPAEQLAQTMYGNTALNLNNSGFSGAGTNYYQNALDRAQNPQHDPNLQAAIDATLRDVTNQTMGPGGVFSQIRGDATDAGAYGSSRQGVLQSLGLQRLADSLGATSANMRMTGRAQDIGAASSAISSLPQISGAATLPADLLGAAGGQQRGMNQANIDALMRAWAYNTYQPDVRLQNFFSSIGAAPLGGYQTGSSTMSPAALAALQRNTPQTASTIQNLLGGAAGAGGIYQLLRGAGFFPNGLGSTISDAGSSLSDFLGGLFGGGG